MRLSSLGYLIKQGAGNIWHNRIISLASFCIMTVSLLLIGFTVIFSANIDMFVSSVENKNEVIIYIKDGTSEEDIDILGDKLKSTANVASVYFYSKEEAFEDIKKDMTDAEEIFSYLGDESPLPDSYRIKIADIDNMSPTLIAIEKYDNIEKVKAPIDFVNVLTGLNTMITVVCSVILVALIVVSFVIISNTTRASVDMRKREIHIMKFVGATNTFIKIPFFFEGLMLGLLAGLASYLLTWAGYDSLLSVLSSETTVFKAMGISGFIPFARFSLYAFLGYIAVGAVISSIGTVLSTRKYVKV
ncbi:MAG: permease-like cell division protein FtsX [Oscillospiraceae bacterium]|nr:permease-like cell division protein FtsX [Oscillospiraceae bacterium]MCR5805405.1 permease-like cell division protein FtsX [Oscillospiraceae bacterium]